MDKTVLLFFIFIFFGEVELTEFQLRRDKPEQFDSPFYLKTWSSYISVTSYISLPEGELQPSVWDGAV